MCSIILPITDEATPIYPFLMLSPSCYLRHAILAISALLNTGYDKLTFALSWMTPSFQRLCMLNKVYVEQYEQMFALQYETSHRLDPTKLRNVSKFFGHLLHTDSISWGVLQVSLFPSVFSYLFFFLLWSCRSVWGLQQVRREWGTISNTSNHKLIEKSL